MTALSANKDRPVRIPPGGLRTEKFGLSGYTNYGGGSTAFTVYKGAVVIIDVSDTDGYAAPMAVNAASGDMFAGIAAERQDVGSSDTADGSVALTVYTNGIWGFPKASLAITDVGAVIYATDTDAVTTTSTNAITIGRLVDVDATYAWIDISTHWMVPI
jgi:hypothetical protein